MSYHGDVHTKRKFRFAITSGIEVVQKLNRKRSRMDIFDEERQRRNGAV
jgi:hypothetical protein